MHEQDKRLTDAELQELFDRLFPNGLIGAGVLAEIAPDGWERTPLLACFHPSVARLFEEQLLTHRTWKNCVASAAVATVI